MFVQKHFSCILVLFFLSILFIVFVPACNNIQTDESQNKKEESILKGKKLAISYCRSCHQFPEPSLLDKKSWEKGVLPHMGPLLGIYEFNYQRYPANINDVNLPKGFYPDQPALKPEEWQNIIDYYVTSSPDTLPSIQRKTVIANDLPHFTTQIPTLKYDNPSTSIVKIRQKPFSQELLICDLFRQKVYQVDKKLKVSDSMISSGAIVDIDFQQNAMLTCNIGIFNPTNSKYGEARYIRINANGKLEKDKAPLFGDLTRPVQIIPVDLNNDGKTDYMSCEFGYLTGALSWMENLGNNKFERHVLRPVSGAIKAYIKDFNKDGLKDIWALFAQGEEAVFLFTNKGNGQFDEREVLRFPPSYGSSYFEMADFNKDGYPDIVYTCGDNADYSTVLKPYHGIYIFINDGDNHFKQQFFFPMNGCYKAIARDYDGDGDLDIAAIAFFADYTNHPKEGFIYLENKGHFEFQPYTAPEAQKGRWITMEAGDIDGDGKIDLVLGNFSLGPTMLKSKFDWKKGPPFIVLHNDGK